MSEPNHLPDHLQRWLDNEAITEQIVGDFASQCAMKTDLASW